MYLKICCILSIYGKTYLEFVVSFNNCWFHILVTIMKSQEGNKISTLSTFFFCAWIFCISFCLSSQSSSFVSDILNWTILVAPYFIFFKFCHYYYSFHIALSLSSARTIKIKDNWILQSSSMPLAANKTAFHSPAYLLTSSPHCQYCNPKKHYPRLHETWYRFESRAS